MDEKGGIGKNNQLAWHLPTDLKRFKNLTMGHYLVMGRKTFETIGRPLPGREMVVITRQRDYSAPGCCIAHSLKEAMKLAEDHHESELFIIGGGEIFQQAIDIADKIYMTTVHTDIQADVKFPHLNREQWTEAAVENATQSDQDQYPSDFGVLLRKQ